MRPSCQDPPGADAPDSALMQTGWFVEPTVFTGLDDSSEVNRNEIFGPVTSVHTFETEEEAIRRANDTGEQQFAKRCLTTR